MKNTFYNIIDVQSEVSTSSQQRRQKSEYELVF